MPNSKNHLKEISETVFAVHSVTATKNDLNTMFSAYISCEEADDTEHRTSVVQTYKAISALLDKLETEKGK